MAAKKKAPVTVEADNSPFAFARGRMAASGIPLDKAKVLRLVPGPAPAELGLPASAYGFKIPYFDAYGTPIAMYRFRTNTEDLSGFPRDDKAKSKLRYRQPLDTMPAIYLSPVIDNWPELMNNPGLPIYLTEGEMKATAMCLNGFPTIGIGGVHNWRSSRLGLYMLSTLADWVWKDRFVYICFDSDAVTNVNIRFAESKLISVLGEQLAQPRLVRIPEDTVTCKKVAADDYLLAYGADKFQELVDSASADDLLRALTQMNATVCYVDAHTKIFRYADNKFIDRQEFINGTYANVTASREVTKNDKTVREVVSVAKLWIAWRGRAQYANVEYSPGKDAIYIENVKRGEDIVRKDINYNTWLGFPTKAEVGPVGLFTRLLDFICENESAEVRRKVEQWFAYPIQHPGAKLFTALVVWGTEQGTGKTLLGETVGRVYGPDNTTDVNQSVLEKQFNAWTYSKQFVIGSEITGSDSRKFADKLKDMITGKTMNVEKKFVDSVSVKNIINYYFTSNHSDAFFIDDNDRRFFVIQTPNYKLDAEFYAEYDKYFIRSDAGVAALRYHFEHLDLTGFNPTERAPNTKGKETMTESGRSGVADWVIRWRDERASAVQSGYAGMAYRTYTREEVFEAYKLANEDDRRTGIVGIQRTMIACRLDKLAKRQQVRLSNGTKLNLWGDTRDKELVKMTGTQVAALYEAERKAHNKEKAKFQRAVK